MKLEQYYITMKANKNVKNFKKEVELSQDHCTIQPVGFGLVGNEIYDYISVKKLREY
jgi:hypothetical protein